MAVQPKRSMRALRWLGALASEGDLGVHEAPAASYRRLKLHKTWAQGLKLTGSGLLPNCQEISLQLNRGSDRQQREPWGGLAGRRRRGRRLPRWGGGLCCLLRLGPAGQMHCAGQDMRSVPRPLQEAPDPAVASREEGVTPPGPSPSKVKPPRPPSVPAGSGSAPPKSSAAAAAAEEKGGGPGASAADGEAPVAVAQLTAQLSDNWSIGPGLLQPGAELSERDRSKPGARFSPGSEPWAEQ